MVIPKLASVLVKYVLKGKVNGHSKTSMLVVMVVIMTKMMFTLRIDYDLEKVTVMELGLYWW